MKHSNEEKSQTNYRILDIPIIDKQHFKFFVIFDNLLLINKEKNEGIREIKILTELNELQKYTVYHFFTEERLMKNANWEYIEQHIEQHSIFKNKCMEFMIDYNYRNRVLLEEIVLFLRKWFIAHISDIDASYADRVKAYLTNREEKKEEYI